MTFRSLAAFALLLVLLLETGAHAAARGKRFYDGLANPGELATLVDAGIAKDATGKSMLDSSRCRAPHWSCASPADYVTIIRVFDPGAHVQGQELTVANLSAFLRKLVVRAPPPGKYWMACVAPVKAGAEHPSGYAPITNCVARAFHTGETAWVDPDTGRVVLARDCTNPVGAPEQETGCADIIFPVKPGDEIRVMPVGPTDIEANVCTGVRRAGEADFESLGVERCPDTDCFFEGARDAMPGATFWPVGSWTEKVDGYTVIRVPLFITLQEGDYRVFICLRTKNGVQSCGLGVRWFDYLNRQNPYAPAGDTMIATIEPYPSLLAGKVDRLGQPSDLAFDFSDCQ